MSSWVSLEIKQLQELLTVRGLPIDGTKVDLIQRLVEYDLSSNNTALENEATPADDPESLPAGDIAEEDTQTPDMVVEETPAMAVDEEPIKKDPHSSVQHIAPESLCSAPPMVQRSRLTALCRYVESLRSLIVSPCTNDVLGNPVFANWMSQAAECLVKKVCGHECTAAFYFHSVEAGEQAFRELTQAVASDQVKVSHFMVAEHNQSVFSWVDEKFKCEEEEMDFEQNFKRLVVLENLPDTATDNELAKAFPGCRAVLSFLKEEGSEGVAFVEMSCSDEVREWVAKYKENPLLIQDSVILVSNYMQRFSIWQKLYQVDKDRLRKAGLGKKPDEPVEPFLDAERQNILDQIKALEIEIESAFDSVELSIEEKLEKLRIANLELYPLVGKISWDTQLRLRKQVLIPEPAAERIQAVKNLIEKDNQRKEKKKEKKANKQANKIDTPPQPVVRRTAAPPVNYGRNHGLYTTRLSPKKLEAFKRPRVSGYGNYDYDYGYSDMPPPLMSTPTRYTGGSGGYGRGRNSDGFRFGGDYGGYGYDYGNNYNSGDYGEGWGYGYGGGYGGNRGGSGGGADGSSWRGGKKKINRGGAGGGGGGGRGRGGQYKSGGGMANMRYDAANQLMQ